MRPTLHVWLLCSLALLLQICRAQTPAAPAAKHTDVPSVAARQEDVLTLDGIIKAYYEVISGPAGRPREWARDRTLYIPGIRFVVFEEDAGNKIMAHLLTHQEFVDASNEDAVGKGFYEREVHRVAHRYGNVVHVFSTSESRRTPGGPVLGRSVDSLELYWDGQRWWITNANIWPKARPGAPLPPEFQPGTAAAR